MNALRCRIEFAIVLVVAAVMAPRGDAQDSRPSLRQRITELGTRLEATRAEQKIPGLVVGIVLDDKVIYRGGFGSRDVKQKLPANDKTLFAIGSTTKAFTSALVAMLIDEGKISGFDALARPLVPGLTFRNSEANEKATLRDLLSHRVGLSRMDLCWYAGTSSTEDILKAVKLAEPGFEFRKGWAYNNPMFLAAGIAAGTAAGSDWATLVKSKIFSPLGMKDACTSILEMAASAEPATGYRVDKDTGEFIPVPMRDLTRIAPAGAINANVKDMTQWLRFQLGRGAFEGRRLVSEKLLRETWTRASDLPGGAGGYGLGWMLTEWNGTPCIEHGGNIDGFAAWVGFLPEKNAGAVMLCNTTVAPIQGTIGSMVWETLFPTLDAKPGALPAEKLQELVGDYRFDAMGVDCKLAVKDGRLHMNVPGQTNYELRWPDAEGFWFFALTNAIKIRFDRDVKGAVTGLTLHQAGLKHRMAKNGVPRVESPSPLTHAQLRVLEGTYKFVPRNEDWVVKVVDGRLGVDVPNQMFFKLEWPDGEGFWVAEVGGGMKLRFQESKPGVVESMRFVQGKETYTLVKTKEPSSEPLPELDELLRARAKTYPPEALAALGHARLRGSVEFAQQGITGKTEFLFHGAEAYRQSIDMGPYGRMVVAFERNEGFAESLNSPRRVFKGVALDDPERGGPYAWVADPRTRFVKVVVTAVEERSGERCALLTCTRKDDTPSSKVWLRLADGVTLGESGVSKFGDDTPIPTQVNYGDFKAVGGVPFPTRVEWTSPAFGKIILRLSETDAGLTPPPGGYFGAASK